MTSSSNQIHTFLFDTKTTDLSSNANKTQISGVSRSEEKFSFNTSDSSSMKFDSFDPSNVIRRSRENNIPAAEVVPKLNIFEDEEVDEAEEVKDSKAKGQIL